MAGFVRSLVQRFLRPSQAELPRRPEYGLYVSGRRDDLWSDTSARRLNPARLGRILREAEAGDIARQAEVFDKVEEDPHILATYGKRKRAALTKTLKIDPADDSAKAKEVAETCADLVDAIPGRREAFFHLLDAIGRAFSVAQTVWDYQDGRDVVVGLQYWKQREFVLDEDDPDAIRVRTDSDANKGEPLAYGQWIVHRYKARSGHLAETAIFRGLAWAYLFKHASWRDWVIFSEAYGMPRRIGTYPRGADTEERNVVKQAAFLLGRDGAAAIPEGAKLELLAAKAASGELPFPDLITLSDNYASKLLLGQTLTTEAGERGARSLGEVHKEVEDELVESDCEALAETLREQLIKPIVGFNFGWDVAKKLLPKVSFAFEEDEDLLQRARRDKILAVDMGLPMSIAQLRAKYDAQEPESEEDTLIVPQRRAAAAGEGRAAREALLQLIDLAAEKKRSQAWAT